MRQTTIDKTVSCGGIGLHSGKKVDLTLRPAPEDSGILFAILNGSGHSFLSPDPKMVVDTGLATTLGNGRDCVATVEHLLAAVRGMGIDNIRIEVDGGELPIMDGSAAPFVYLLKQAGVRNMAKARRVLALKRPINFEADGKYIQGAPHDGLALDYTIDFAHPLIGAQRMVLDVSPGTFARELAKARTFGFLKEVEYLHANGLALGGSLDNAVVLDDYRVVNDEGLRFEDEFVRHKALDFIGDMGVMGMPVWGRFTVFASGHKFNNEFWRYLADNADDYLEERVLGEGAGKRRKAPAMEENLAGVPAMA